MNELAPFVADPVAVVFTSQSDREQLYERIKKEIAAFTPDVSTTKGRKEIAALAYKITRTKTAIDAAGKELAEQRRVIKADLEALATEVRRPLTEWEEAEEARKAEMARVIGMITMCSTAHPADTSAALTDKIRRLEIDIAIDPDIFLDETDAWERKITAASIELRTALAIAFQREVEAAELARLRKAEKERLAKEATRAAAEAAAKAKAEVEERRQQAAKDAYPRRPPVELPGRAPGWKDNVIVSGAVYMHEPAQEQPGEIEAADIFAHPLPSVVGEEELARLAAIPDEQESYRTTPDVAVIDPLSSMLERELPGYRTTSILQEMLEHRRDVVRADIAGPVITALIDLGADKELARTIFTAIEAGEIPHVRLED